MMQYAVENSTVVETCCSKPVSYNSAHGKAEIVQQSLCRVKDKCRLFMSTCKSFFQLVIRKTSVFENTTSIHF